jgi:eukaryotic-like serine/threonine-protein kinase
MAEPPTPEFAPTNDLPTTTPPQRLGEDVPTPESDSSHLKAWGDFQLLQHMGHGGFGEVYRAWDPVLEREVALKLLLPRGLDPEQEFASIVAEARAMARIRHPNIVSVYGVDRRDGRVGFWSDFVRGHTLTVVIAMQGPMDDKTTSQIGVSLCDALAAVHNAGLLHRDIKASNAMRDDSGRILLMDFGLSQNLLAAAAVSGTPGYQAPEVLAGHPASVQSDIYAMGILLRFLATGGHSAAPGTERGQGSSTRLLLPASLEQIIQKATDRDPKLRYASAVQMREELRSLEKLQAETKTPANHGSLIRRKWLWVVTLVLVLLAAGVTFAPRLLRRAQNGAPGQGSPAYQDYLSAEDALLRYDKPGNTDKAIGLYLSVLQRSPNHALAEAGLARAYWRKYFDTSENKWADVATQAGDKAIEMNPNLAAVQMTVGMIHADQGKFDVGLQELQLALQLDPRSADVHAALGEAYRQQGRILDAKNELQTAIDLAPDNWRWPYLLGALQIDSGDFKSAEQNLNLALARTADNTRVLYNLGIVYQKEERLPEAQAVLEKAIDLDPNVDSMQALGLTLLLQGNNQQAINVYRRAAGLKTAGYEAWGNLAAAYQRSGQYPKETREAYQMAVALALAQIKNTPENPYLVSVLGQYYANLQDANDALKCLRKSVVLAPHDPDVLERVAESYEVLGEREEALNFISQALKLGFSIRYVKSVPTLKALREDPSAPEVIREPRNSNQPHGDQR